MSKYIRAQFNHPDDIYFLTLVTRERFPFFDTSARRAIAIEQLFDLAHSASGELLAWVVMPDHIHLLMRQGNKPFSRWINTFKRRLNLCFLQRQGTLWQPRFWEHRVRDEQDLKKYLDYIHANPFEADLVEDPASYDASSFQMWLERGEYQEGWCGEDVTEPPWKGGD